MKNPFRDYNGRLFAGDLFGGAIAALIALPYGLAMASLMGLPPILGLYTSLFAAPICALLGRNPVLIGGTSSATVPFILGAVRAGGISGAAKICIFAAVFLLIFCIMRLGRYVAKVPHSVLAGFSCGIGGLMVISQLKVIFALKAPPGGWSESMFGQLIQSMEQFRQFHWLPALIAGIVMLISTLVRMRYPRLPGPFLGVGIVVAVAALLGWKVNEVGAIPLTMPPFIGFTWAPADVFKVLPSALGLAFVASVELLMTSRVVDHFRGRHKLVKKVDADMELGAYGIANLICGFFAAPTSVGIPARSVANVQCGATTKISNVVHGALLWGMMTVGATYISHVPLAALAGVTAWMGFRLLDWGTWKRLPKMRLVDAVAFLATAAGVLIEDAVIAITIGCALYLLRYLLLRFVGAPAWLERQEQEASTHEQAAAAAQSSASLTTTSASK
ncbi:MAG TPA: SulP family inorganic anion transporter [Bryobacteraceae bacterium]|nr:SulP family inorganic anion transporter [Bryobacteraceae bacterium]